MPAHALQILSLPERPQRPMHRLEQLRSSKKSKLAKDFEIELDGPHVDSRYNDSAELRLADEVLGLRGATTLGNSILLWYAAKSITSMLLCLLI